MGLYKFFLMRDGGPTAVVKRQLANDLDALEAAHALSGDHVVEVYEDTRLVARVKQGDQPRSGQPLSRDFAARRIQS